MRTFAEVGESTLCISSYVSVLKFGDEFAFVGLSFGCKVSKRICFAYLTAYERLFALLNLLHLLLYNGQVGFFNSLTISGKHIVVEPVFDCRTYTELNTRVEFLQSLCHKVRGGVPEGMFGFSIVPFMQTDMAVFVDRLGEIYLLPILFPCLWFVVRGFCFPFLRWVRGCFNSCCKHFLCKSLTNVFCYL